ncbi:MAG: alpha/beta hydrolase [Burkholderiaceae bacterium]
MHQLPTVTEKIKNRMSELGPIWGLNVANNVREMVELFSEILEKSPRENLESFHEISYGPDERHVLDIFKPVKAVNAPVLVFVHGGAFVDGSKDRSKEIYSNALRCFNRFGYVGINLEYRLAPTHKYPSGTDDIESSLNWITSHIQAYGGDPRRIFLMSHSAGAAHTCDYLYNPKRKSAAKNSILGHIIVSGRVRIEMRNDNPNAKKVEAYYGNNPEIHDSCSAVNTIGTEFVETMIAIAEFENPLIDIHCIELAHKISQTKNKSPRITWLEGHNHTSIISSLDTSDTRLSDSILNFMNKRLNA